MNRKETAIELYRKVRKKQLDDMLARMPDDKRGVEITNNGITYLAFIRRLTPTECDRLQAPPLLSFQSQAVLLRRLPIGQTPMGFLM